MSETIPQKAKRLREEKGLNREELAERRSMRSVEKAIKGL